jgi:pimeloyl-ACP methyl ester carboxylesterase
VVPTQPPIKVAVRSLSEIKVPALILVGEYDIPDVHAHAGVINAGIANSKREIIPRSGHLIPIEQPAIFNEAVMNFLNKLPR